ncbi:TetR/AcrR family transcriptional regulator [Chelatococcus reniformis]|uniref:TetR family transcriptional regulator n=1 Tax=Chelatococcus reniformis TaxID=1494448 RepID=A0A916UV57_9HYPH|nr:TetR/AcrR family transcriptional regulator [Chelatococcus reniformis]GGC89415.1 TetR family transcriptional regulator [Chelatococcus reniformis]
MAARRMANGEASSRYEQRRLEVLRAAARTFNRLGFHVATLDDVAAELGVTKPALYYYAKSKDELIFACGKRALDALAVVLDKSGGPNLTARQRLCRFFALYAEVICEDFGRCLALTEPGDLSPDSRTKTVAGRRALNHAIREMIRDGVKDGSLRACDERALSMALFDSFNGLARWFDSDGAQALAEVVEQYLAIFLQGVSPVQASPAAQLNGAKAAPRRGGRPARAARAKP